MSTLSSYQQVSLLSPRQTSIRFIPMAMTGFSINVVTGYAMGRMPGQILILIGLSETVVCPNDECQRLSCLDK
jgi:hypothetical protein